MNAKNFHDEQQDYQEKAIANIINIFDDFKKIKILLHIPLQMITYSNPNLDTYSTPC